MKISRSKSFMQSLLRVCDDQRILYRIELCHESTISRFPKQRKGRHGLEVITVSIIFNIWNWTKNILCCDSWVEQVAYYW